MRQLELFAERVRRLAGVNSEEIVDAAQLANRLIGPGSVVIVDRLACGARLRWVENGYRIELQEGLSDINFACAHELAHWALRELEHYEGPDEERFANYVGAALVAPRALVRAAATFYGAKLESVEPMSGALMISQTAATLRLGEVLGDDRVVVTKSGNVLRSSEEAFPEPDRRIVAFARSKRARPGVVKVALRGGIDTHRIALRTK